MRSPWALSSPGWPAITLSAFPHMRDHSSCGPLLILSGMFMSLSYPGGAQMWPRPSRSPAVSRGQVHLPWCAGITRPNAAQDIICFSCSKGAFLPRIQSGAHQDHAKLLCSWVASSMYQCMRWFFPTCRSLYFHLLNFIRLLFACFSSLSRALWMSSWSWGLSASFVSSLNLLRVHSAQLSRQYKKMLNGAGPSIDTWASP